MKAIQRKFRDLLFFASFCCLAAIVACSSGQEALTDDPAVAREDSIAQSSMDADSIDWYIAQNSYENVITEESGVRHLILEPGSGELPEFNDIVSMHYASNFLNGKVFDTTIEQVALDNDIWVDGLQYNPIRFNFTASGSAITGYIPGFTEGLTQVLMTTDENDQRIFSKGGKAILMIPSASAYGIDGSTDRFGTADGVVPPNTVLVFEITFESIRP
ncbi:MAG: FKBP-type peptidyl-prolyl cis-trans isomerase [Cyclobacteriaceae bacterium]